MGALLTHPSTLSDRSSAAHGAGLSQGCVSTDHSLVISTQPHLAHPGLCLWLGVEAWGAAQAWGPSSVAREGGEAEVAKPRACHMLRSLVEDTPPQVIWPHLISAALSAHQVYSMLSHVFPAVRRGSILWLHRPPPRAELASICLAVATGSSPGVILTTTRGQGPPGPHQDSGSSPRPTHTPAGWLSAKQLALRRGAALTVAVGSLIAGLVLGVLTARP